MKFELADLCSSPGSPYVTALCPSSSQSAKVGEAGILLDDAASCLMPSGGFSQSCHRKCICFAIDRSNILAPE